jgi:hypothetical protein
MKIVKHVNLKCKIKSLIDQYREIKVKKVLYQREINLTHALKESGKIRLNL